MLTVGSLFTGIGGIDLACEWAGMEIIWQCDNDPFCRKVLNKHWPNVRKYRDIRELHGSDIERPDVLVGGFPCQPVSVAGKRRGKEDDRWLWPEMFRLVQELRPTWVVGENVAGLIRLGLDDCLSDLEGIGYATQTFVIPACAVNAPHRRDRVWILAYSASNLRGTSGHEGPATLDGSGPPLSHPECQYDRRRQQDGDQTSERHETANHCQDVGDPQGRRFQAQCQSERNKPSRASIGCASWRRSESRLGDVANGLSQWLVEPDIPRVCHGAKDRVAKLKALGNAVVPQQIYPIMKAIAEIGGL